ncbi:hypothetical protein [Vibrio phage VpKK5]|uniref:hypothetical protein n=1 Tax=Vibrio phage VpKK5 TaxID=1538804 RepID=UPI0004F86F1B|nr:hypothetical protein VC55_gp76 [Vibrio phage VpKK5]AIM40579.1 hypothetical protein [Vibrio phage VpKK5]
MTAIKNAPIEVVKTDPKTDFCDCCHVFGCEEMTRIELVPTPGRSDKWIYLCEDCYPKPASEQETVVTDFETQRSDAKHANMVSNSEWTVEEMLINAIAAIRKGEIQPQACLVLALDRGTEEEPAFISNYFMSDLKASEAIALCEIGKIQMLESMNYVR